MGLTPSPMEIAVIAIIALIVLGPNKLPEAARSVGKGLREMRDSFSGKGDDLALDDYDESDEDELEADDGGEWPDEDASEPADDTDGAPRAEAEKASSTPGAPSA